MLWRCIPRRSFASRVDSLISGRLSETMRGRYNHPAGPKTIHFWAPTWKWALVFAGIGNYFRFFFENFWRVLTLVFCRPADKLSLNQSASLTATGFIWARYSMIIIPKNYVLFSVNVALGLTGLMQVMRVLHYQTTDEYQKLQVQN